METERLQGFPDGWCLGSETQIYSQCGNAVTTEVIKEIMTAWGFTLPTAGASHSLNKGYEVNQK